MNFQERGTADSRLTVDASSENLDEGVASLGLVGVLASALKRKKVHVVSEPGRACERH